MGMAAVVLDPLVQGTGGIRFHHPCLLRRLWRLCDKTGVLLMFAKVATGFRKTGLLFAE